MKVKNCRLLRSISRPEEVPDLLFPSVAFVGRSNVGKSSLLNRLVGSGTPARVSKTPGRTRIVNYFLLDGRLVFIDLPGYGYANVPESVRASWRSFSEAALEKGGGPSLTVLLVDARHEPTELDRMMAGWLEEKEIEWVVALTKFDKLKASDRLPALERASTLTGGRPGVATSARTGAGISDLWKRIGAASDRRRVQEVK